MAVLNGKEAGPRIWLSATVHGDELNGMEIIRRVLREIDVKNLRGCLIAVPVINVCSAHVPGPGDQRHLARHGQTLRHPLRRRAKLVRRFEYPGSSLDTNNPLVNQGDALIHLAKA